MMVGNRLWRFSGSLYTRAEGLYIRGLKIKLILIMKLYQFMYLTCMFLIKILTCCGSQFKYSSTLYSAAAISHKII